MNVFVSVLLLRGLVEAQTTTTTTAAPTVAPATTTTTVAPITTSKYSYMNKTLVLTFKKIFFDGISKYSLREQALLLRRPQPLLLRPQVS